MYKNCLLLAVDFPVGLTESTMKAAYYALYLCLALIATEGTVAMSRFTPLEIDNHPCTPEKLKVTKNAEKKVAFLKTMIFL